jgi:Spore germination B3/ GerAC like, C-terminal.
MTGAERFLHSIVIIILFFHLTGCGDIKSIEDLNIPIASGYELISQPNSDNKQMEIYAVFPVFYKNAPQKYIVDITRSDSIGESRSTRLEHLSEPLSLGSLQTTVIGNDLAREGISDVLYILLRTPQMKNTITLAVADGSIADIFSVKPDNYPNVGTYLISLLSNTFKETYISKSDVHQVSIALYTPGWHPIIPMIRADGKKIKISRYGIFKGDKLTQTITIPEARILSILQCEKNIGDWTYSIALEGKITYKVAVRMTNTANIGVSRDKSGYHIKVNIKSKGALIELLPDKNHQSFDNTSHQEDNLLKNKAVIDEIKKGYEIFLKEQAEALIMKAQKEFKMDIFNWVKFAQAKWRNDIDNMDWDFCFTHIDVNVNVKVSLKYIGEES